MMKLLPAFVLAMAVTASPALADQSSIAVEHAWLRATPKGAPVAGGYVTIVNRGSEADRLVGVTLAGTEKGEIHSMSMDGGTMRMRRLDGLDIPPGANVTLQPGGNHLMFFNPSSPLAEGRTAMATLTFEKAGPIAVTFTIAGMAAKSAPDASAVHDHAAMPGH